MPIGCVKVYLKKQCMNECMIEINLLQVTNVAKNTNMYLAY